MKKFIPLLSLLILMNPLSAQYFEGIKVAIADMTRSTGTHVYATEFNDYRTPIDVFDYGKYTIAQLKADQEKLGLNVIETEVPMYYENISILNFIGKPTREIKSWLSQLSRDADADYLILIKRKFIPDKDLSHRYLGRAEYGVATFLDIPDELWIFSFLGYYIFSVRDQKLIHINPNHDRYVLKRLKLNTKLSSDERKNLPPYDLEMVEAELRYIADSRLLFIEEMLKEYQEYPVIND